MMAARDCFLSASQIWDKQPSTDDILKPANPLCLALLATHGRFQGRLLYAVTAVMDARDWKEEGSDDHPTLASIAQTPWPISEVPFNLIPSV